MKSRRTRIDLRSWLFLCCSVVYLFGAPADGDAQTPSREPGAALVETYDGTPVGFTKDGAPYRGSADAPLTVVEYTDYLCPFCEMYFRQTLPDVLDRYVRTGQVKFVVRDLPLASLHPTAPRGAAAAACVAEQGAQRFWRMHDELFRAQSQWSRLPDPTAALAGLARTAGAAMKAYETCIAAGRGDARVQQSVSAAQALGFNGTPTFQFVHRAGGKTHTLAGTRPAEVFARWVDALLAGTEPPDARETQEARKPELPFWAKPDGIAPDPGRTGFTVAGDRYKGNPRALVAVVEFVDFQCPSCQRHALETQPVLDRRFVETGDVLWIVKHFPLRMHARAPVAAAAVECAGDQGKFWAMEHRVFERMEQWSTSDDADASLVQLAVELGLDRGRFTACFTGRPALERVLRDLYDGQAIGLRSSPTFLVLYGGTARVLAGARSPEQFAATLAQQLENAHALATTPAVATGP